MAPETTDSARYARCLHNAQKVNWDIDSDVIRFRQLDVPARVYREPARHFTRGRAAHAVADHEQAFVGAQHVVNLIELAYAPGMRACTDFQPHGSVIYKHCADRREMPEVVRARRDPAAPWRNRYRK